MINLEHTTKDTIESSKAHQTETLYLYQFGASSFDFRFKAIPPESKEQGVLIAIYRNGESISTPAF